VKIQPQWFVTPGKQTTTNKQVSRLLTASSDLPNSSSINGYIQTGDTGVTSIVWKKIN
jgi:hypothetical protein